MKGARPIPDKTSYNFITKNINGKSIYEKNLVKDVCNSYSDWIQSSKLNNLQKEVALKGFRPGKVPPTVIKSQFGKSIYGEVVDKILRDTSSKAIDEKKLKVAGQPKIDLKQFGEGKD